MADQICPCCDHAPLEFYFNQIWQCADPRCRARYRLDADGALRPEYEPAPFREVSGPSIGDALAVGVVAVAAYALITSPEWLPALKWMLRL